MSRMVVFSRGEQGQLGSNQSLPFWRRIQIPFTELHRQIWFDSFTSQVCDPDCSLTLGQLVGPDVVIIQNWVPRDEDELQVFADAIQVFRPQGKLPCLIYDLEEPQLLQNPLVRQLLPLAQLITVPNQYLLEEVQTVSRSMLQRVAMLPSTFDMSTLVSLPPSPTSTREEVFDPDHPLQALFTIGCWGNHDWQFFIPSFFTELAHRLPLELFHQVCVQTDSNFVFQYCQDSGFYGRMVHPFPFSYPSYPQYLGRCNVGLCPRDGQDGRDICWLAEYGAVSCPVLAAIESSYHLPDASLTGITLLDINDPDMWAELLSRWILTKAGDEERCKLGALACSWSKEQRVQAVIGQYSHLYRQFLPSSLGGL